MGKKKVTWEHHQTATVTGRTTKQTIKLIKEVFKNEIVFSDLLESKKKISEIKERVEEQVRAKVRFFPSLRTRLATREFNKILKGIDTKIEATWAGINAGNIKQLCDEIDSQCVNEREAKTGKTLLHYAATLHNQEAVETLLKKGADLESQDKEGNTPLHCALDVKKGDQLELFLMNRSTPKALRLRNGRGEEPFSFAMKKQNKSFCEEILKKITDARPLKFVDNQGNTPWHFLAIAGNGLQDEIDLREWMKLLEPVLDQHEPNLWFLRNADKKTPVDIAVQYGTKPIIYKLFNPFEKQYFQPDKVEEFAGRFGSPGRSLIERVKGGSMGESQADFREKVTFTGFCIAASCSPEIQHVQASEVSKEHYPELRYILENPGKIQADTQKAVQSGKEKANKLLAEIATLPAGISESEIQYVNLYHHVVPSSTRNPVLQDNEVQKLKKWVDNDTGNSFWHMMASNKDILKDIISAPKLRSTSIPELFSPGASQKFSERNKKNLTPLHLAIDSENVEFFEALYAPGAHDNPITDWNALKTRDGMPILHYAVQHFVEVAKKYQATKPEERVKLRESLDNTKRIIDLITSSEPSLVFAKDHDGLDLKQYLTKLKSSLSSDEQPIFANLGMLIENPGKLAVERRIEKQKLAYIHSQCGDALMGKAGKAVP